MNPSTNRMLNRVKDVYLYIKENGTVTTQELVDAFEMNQRTIQRDLNILTYNNLVKSISRGKWTITDKKVRVS